ncbi:MAG: hypothetical protein H6Q73_1060 [Firmicutes bacterium]|nr:hypothetical protein [Bacillota bacterium]
MVNGAWLAGKRIMFVFLVVVLFSVNIGYCEGYYASTQKRDWIVPNFGVFEVPDKFYAKDLSDFGKLLTDQRKIITEGTDCIKAQMPLAGDPDISIYQITINDRQVYHQAWVAIVKDKRPSASVDTFRSILDNIVNRTSLIEGHNALIRDIDKLRYNDENTGIGIKVLELLPVEFPIVNGTKAVGGSARVLVNIKGLVFPLYVKGYLFIAGECFAGVGLMTTDSDREFWNQVMSEMIGSLKLKSVKVEN